MEWLRQSGTWAIPKNLDNVAELRSYLGSLGNDKQYNVEQVENKLYPLVGDDQLFDQLDDAGREGTLFGSTIKDLVVKKLVQLITQGSEFPPEVLRKLQEIPGVVTRRVSEEFVDERHKDCDKCGGPMPWEDENSTCFTCRELEINRRRRLHNQKPEKSEEK